MLRSLILGVCLINSFVWGQNVNFDWVRTLSSSSGGVEGHVVCEDNSGNIFFAGNYAGVIDLDPGPSTYTITSQGGVNAFLCKYDALGNFQYGGNISSGTSSITCTSLKIDSLGNIVIVGNFYGAGDFDPGSGINYLNSAGSSDMFISKFNNSGQLLWAKALGGIGEDMVNSMILGSSNEIYLAGGFSDSLDFSSGGGAPFQGSLGNSDAFICKLNGNGNYQWVKIYSGISLQSIWKIKLDAYGNPCFLGFFHGSQNFNNATAPLVFSSFGSQDIFFGKVDASGNLLFAKQIGGSGWDSPKGFAIDAGGNLVLTGNYWSNTIDLDPGVQTYTLSNSQGFSVGFVSKYNSQGNFIWARSFTGNGDLLARDLVTDSLNRIYTIGDFSGTSCDFDPSAVKYELISSNGFSYFSALDSIGNFVFAKLFSGSGWTSVYEIWGDHSRFLIPGKFIGTIDFDPGLSTDTVTLINSVGASLAKFSVCNAQIISNSTPPSHLKICDQQSTSLLVNNSGTVYWSAGSAVNSVTPQSSIYFTPTLSTGIYDYYAQTNSNCPALPTRITVTVNALPSVSISGDNNICYGQTTTLSAIGASSYTWNTAQVANSILVSPTDTAKFWVTGVDANLCRNSDTLVMSVQPVPSLSMNASSGVLCSGDQVTISAYGALNYEWSNDEQQQQIVVSPNVSSTYTVTGYNVQGCFSQATISLVVESCLGLANNQGAVDFQFFPNPVVDMLFFKGNRVDGETEAKIFNTEGKMIFRGRLNEQFSLSFENSSAGIYLVSLISNGEEILKKSIIKQ